MHCTTGVQSLDPAVLLILTPLRPAHLSYLSRTTTTVTLLLSALTYSLSLLYFHRQPYLLLPPSLPPSRLGNIGLRNALPPQISAFKYLSYL